MKTTQKTVDFNPDQLRLALFYVENALERVSTPFIVLGDVAYCLRNGVQLNAKKVVVGVKKLEFMEDRKDTFKQMLSRNVVEENDKISFEFEGVPIIIKLYKNDYGFLQYPDQVNVEYGTWRIPNNFDKYWKMRHLVN